MLYFDYPLSDRVRNFIRLSQLSQRFQETVAADNHWMHHVALCTLFEIVECTSRSDLKRDLLHELERQRLQLHSLNSENHEQRLHKLNQAIADLQASHPQSTQLLRENEWLSALKQRLNIAGGTTAVDLPSYHYWLNQTPEQHRQYLNKWIQPIKPVQQAIDLVLENLNKHTKILECQALSGVYQHGGLIQSTQLLRICIDPALGVVPEVSANKYFINISFLQANQETTRSKLAQKDLTFQLILCSFDAPK